MNRVDVYVQRMLDASSTFYGYNADTMLKSEKGWMVMTRTYPRHPLWEETNESKPQWTRSGRFETYRIEPEAIEYGENFIVHREGPEATPYLPNAIFSTNPYIRPDDYGIPITAQHHDDKHVRNMKLPWQEIKRHAEPVVGEGVSVLLRDPEDPAPGAQPVVGQRLGADLRVELRRSVPDGQADAGGRRAPVAHQSAGGEGPGHQRRRLRLCGRQPGGPAVSRLEAERSVLQGGAVDDPGKYNPAYPYHVTMAKHAPYVATAKSVKGHETRPDGRAIAVDTGYQSNFRYGAQQSFTRSWLMPMHLTDSLPGKHAVAWKFKWGFQIDHHGVNTTPKECLIRITKAEDGGIGARGPGSRCGPASPRARRTSS